MNLYVVFVIPTIHNGSIRTIDHTNEDYTTPEYVRMKKKLKTQENNLKRAKGKSDKLDNSTKEIKEILGNTKFKGFNKNQYVLSFDEKEKIDEFVKQVDNINKEYQRIQKL